MIIPLCFATDAQIEAARAQGGRVIGRFIGGQACIVIKYSKVQRCAG